MMGYIYYSPSTRAFYDPELGYAEGTIPKDSVRIRRSSHPALVAARAAHAKISVDSRGRVRAGVVPELDPLTVARAAVRVEAARRIDAIAPLWRQLNALRAGGDDTLFARIDAVRDASNALEASLPTLADDDLAAFDARLDSHWS